MMKNLLILFAIMIVLLTGCRSHKAATVFESSVMNDTIATIINESSGENIEKSQFSMFSADSLGFRLSADSITVGKMVIYGPEISTEGKGVTLRNEFNVKAVAADVISASVYSSSTSTNDKVEDVVQNVSSVPSPGDFFQFAGFLVILLIAAIMVRKFMIRKK